MFNFIPQIYNFISKRQWLTYFIVFTIAFIIFLYVLAPPTLLCPDGFYHTKMALLIKESGIVKDFPWTQFTTYKNLFVDHHFGYHFLLLPFLSIPTPKNFDALSAEIDPLIKIKLASALFAALAILLIYWFLRRLKVKLPLLWVLSSFLIRNFLFRLSLSRSPALSLIILILGLYYIVRKKYLGIFLVSIFYVWTYGGWPLMLVMVILYCFATAIKKSVNKQSLPANRLTAQGVWQAGAINNQQFILFFKSFFSKINIKLLCICALGLITGLIVNPYFPKTFPFYWFQTVKIAILNYQNIIGVGAEWYPSEISNLLLDALPILIPYIISIAWFIFCIKKQKTKEWFFALLSLFFLAYTLKARRIIEYLAPIIIIFNALIFTQIIKSINWNNVKKQIKHLFLSTENNFYFITTIILSFTCIFFLGFYSIRGVHNLMQSYEDSPRPINHLQRASQWIKNNVSASEIIFHSNWDIFPELFYFNDKNYYINGLDQTFMYEYDKNLYEDWRKLFSGKTNPNKTAKIIKENFGASYIITSKAKNNEKFTKLLERSINLEKVYEDEQAIVYENNYFQNSKPSTQLDLIAHALGGLNKDGNKYTYTNSLEALEASYKRGYKMFEVDLSMTKDGHIVASHQSVSNKTLKKFLEKKINNNTYTPLSLEGILSFMKKNQEITIITDIKSDFEDCAEMMIKKIKKYDHKLLKRIIPQVYSEKDIITIEKYHNFKNVIYTLYHLEKINLKNIYKINLKYPFVNTVSISVERISNFLIKELKKNGIKIYLHTLNNNEKILRYYKKGISGIYTDFYYQNKNNI